MCCPVVLYRNRDPGASLLGHFCNGEAEYVHHLQQLYSVRTNPAPSSLSRPVVTATCTPFHAKLMHWIALISYPVRDLPAHDCRILTAPDRSGEQPLHLSADLQLANPACLLNRTHTNRHRRQFHQPATGPE